MTDALFTIDAASAVPPYRQIHDAIVTAISSGRLHPGEKLPTVRALAASLELAPNTIASAYRSLEKLGVIEGRGRAGTFVTLSEDPIESAARELIVDAVAHLKRLGISDHSATTFFLDALKAAPEGSGDGGHEGAD